MLQAQNVIPFSFKAAQKEINRKILAIHFIIYTSGIMLHIFNICRNRACSNKAL